MVEVCFEYTTHHNEPLVHMQDLAPHPPCAPTVEEYILTQFHQIPQVIEKTAASRVNGSVGCDIMAAEQKPEPM